MKQAVWYTPVGRSTLNYLSGFKIGATKEERAQLIEILRPYAERSFADPRARRIFMYLSESGLVDDLDLSFPVDEIELLKDIPLARGVISYDTTLVIHGMSSKNLEQVERFLRIESPRLVDFQVPTIEEGTRKKFFRQAPELRWLKESRFRGLDKRTDKILDRMGS
ncbi:hypothetical protein CGLAU_01770 [Corynebacterium glaucum]|uniref:Uncharacterized protein n=1 Tax=Corynebacterium glaucum TaxID=187491 RepID=A0A1Q2HU35_9CORY|nr:hypothetical protein [Corynebacterium glaucum]AQQ14341.1 hypothetical protein CGLAU_01770 [Corynebacterium glaucum]WJZ06871.1 hypothetical protein CGLAUT_01825 [Corynebacterium glaucum]